MRSCSTCGRSNADDARFCAHCGSALGERCPHCGADIPGEVAFCPSCGTSLATTTSEERRFVTILFADLVGFTAESDEADPEDVRARLIPYHARVREEIERYDGTVEKLIGDGVMAVFGVPTAHEDDPERAVRVGLRIQDAVTELNDAHEGLDLLVRIGINTGEAIVTHGGQGERIVGDVVNTASRLESTAPPGGVVVGEATHRATELMIEYEEMDPVEVKGKAKPLAVWRAIAPRGRYGVDAAVRAPTPFLGRDSEMKLLTETFRRVVDDGVHHLVTVAAEPGVGKSRLVNEFWQWADDQPEIVWWRQGRCLPYGEGITFWALGEIVKGQAGIKESDDAEEAAAKLALALEAITEDAADREWLAAHLGPLVGARAELQSTDRSDAFAAWRRFLEDMAAVQPFVMVIEDLHWADPALIEFLEDVHVWSADVPLMVICTARPELYGSHPGWGGGHRNSATISLAPLADEHIARLLSTLMDQAMLPVETQRSLLDRAGGNPLYAEEFVRMLHDRGMLGGRGHLDVPAGEAIPVPETVQALIGSRLDVLSDDEARAIEDASVAGKVFWEGALDAIGGSGDVRGALRSLVSREWIRPVRVSSVDGEREYAFWHALTRDVAYGRIPRAARARKHQTMAEWIEATTGERAADHAELLAHHYANALELAEASGGSHSGELRQASLRALVMAGDRALPLDSGRAAGYYLRALDLIEPDDPERPRVMLKAGIAQADAGHDVSLELFREAADDALAAGDRITGATALKHAHLVNWITQGTGVAGHEYLDRAIEILEADGARRELAEAYITRGGWYMMTGELDEQLTWSQKGIELAEEFGLQERLARGLSIRGIARFHLGDVEGGMSDLRESVRIANEHATTAQSIETAHVNLADHTWMAVGPYAAREIYELSIERVRARGRDTSWAEAELMWIDFDLGRWDSVLDLATALLDQFGGQEVLFVPWAQSYKAHVEVWRGNLARAAELQSAYLPKLREIADMQLLAPALGLAARTELAVGNREASRSLLREFIDVTEGKSPIYRGLWAVDPTRLLVAVGLVDEADALTAGSTCPGLRGEIGLATQQAIVDEAMGEIDRALTGFSSVAVQWESYGHPLEQALALLGESRCLTALGRGEEADVRAHSAAALLADLGADPKIARLDEADGTAAAL